MVKAPLRMLVTLVGAVALLAGCGEGGTSATTTSTTVAANPTVVRSARGHRHADQGGRYLDRCRRLPGGRGGQPDPADHGTGWVHGRLAAGVRRHPGQ